MPSDDTPAIAVNISPNDPTSPPSPVIPRAQTNMGWPTDEKWWYRILNEEQLMGTPITPLPSDDVQAQAQIGTIIREGGLLRRMAETKRLWEADVDSSNSGPHDELGRKLECKSGQLDVVSFQPCLMPGNESQDRWIARKVVVRDGDNESVWKVLGVFDGHAGHETVDLAYTVLPDMIENNLRKLLETHRGEVNSAEVISTMLKDTIKSLDEEITRKILQIFVPPVSKISPDLRTLQEEAMKTLESMSDEDVLKVIDDKGENQLRLLRGMRGSTALVVLIAPPGLCGQRGIWAASLGDCVAVLGRRSLEGGGGLVGEVLSVNHNGRDEAEVKRIRSEHPGEEECVLKNRVLGSIAVTRALGDHEFKLPQVFTERVFMKSAVKFRLSTKIEDWLPRNLTPPYLSATPDIVYVDAGTTGEVILLCSDGFTDMNEGREASAAVVAKWMEVLSNTAQRSTPNKGERAGLRIIENNEALRLLRDGLGGDDTDAVSQRLTLELDDKWMDDTTIVVHHL